MAETPAVATNLAETTVASAVSMCPLLAGLTEPGRERLIEVSRLVSFTRGETIWLANEPSEWFASVAQGFVKMTRSSPQGKDVTVELMGPGQCVGLLVAIEGRAFPLSAIAVTECTLLKVPTDATRHVFQELPTLTHSVVSALAPRLRRAYAMLSRSAAGTVEERIAAVLEIVMEAYGRTGKKGGVRLTVPLTRQDIADMAGTTVESCIRTMSKWQKAGLISTEHQVVTIHDPMKIKAISEHEAEA